MKRLVLLISAVGLLNFSYGQNHQISAGAGLLSTNAAFSILSKIGQNLSGSVFNGTTTTNGKFFGEFRGTYAYSPLKWLAIGTTFSYRSEEHTSELQSRPHLVCRLLLEKKKKKKNLTILIK